jgi:hypothetical protein
MVVVKRTRKRQMYFMLVKVKHLGEAAGSKAS